MNKPVSFELAKLLKEKGFDNESLNYYRQWYGDIQLRLGSMFSNDPKDDCLPNEEFFLAPTIADVVMWLYEKHEIWISVWSAYNNSYKFSYGVLYRKNIVVFHETNFDEKNTPTEAYEIAIKETLTNIIA